MLDAQVQRKAQEYCRIEDINNDHMFHVQGRGCEDCSVGIALTVPLSALILGHFPSRRFMSAGWALTICVCAMHRLQRYRKNVGRLWHAWQHSMGRLSACESSLQAVLNATAWSALHPQRSAACLVFALRTSLETVWAGLRHARLQPTVRPKSVLNTYVSS
jgi:hypothetical protein